MDIICVYSKDAALMMDKHSVAMLRDRVENLTGEHRFYLFVILNYLHSIWYHSENNLVVKDSLAGILKEFQSNHSKWYHFLRVCKKNKLMYTTRFDGELQYCFYLRGL